MEEKSLEEKSLEEKLERLRNLAESTISRNTQLILLMKLTQEMRQKQIAFFKTPLTGVEKKNLQRDAQYLERKVDAQIIEIQNSLKKLEPF
jgi:ABC-type phosphate/phosphonate transport system substrate-binding protein